MNKKLISILLASVLVFVCTGCKGQGADNGQGSKETGSGGKTRDLMAETELADLPKEPDEEAGNGAEDRTVFCRDAADFAVGLLRENMQTGEGNRMVSPVSVMTALAMTANGAKGETLSQMLSVIGPGQEPEELNRNLKSWTEALPGTEGAGVKIANSVWFKDDEGQIRVEESFLRKNAEYFGAGIYKAPFDEGTLSDINTWVSDNTDNRIDRILEEIPKEAVMYLVNAVAFEAEWMDIYGESQIWEETFTDGGGREAGTDFMHSEEKRYLEDDRASGFIKPYKEGYSFVAILPAEGVTPKDYMDSLTGEHFLSLLSGAKEATVYTSLPKFEAEYGVELKDILAAMGMADAFDAKKADFGGIGTSKEGNICIGQVFHKTYIAVDGMGTKAGAATAVEMVTEMAAMEEGQVYYVYLDRPFLYAIVENETNLPLFFGVVNIVQGW